MCHHHHTDPTDQHPTLGAPMLMSARSPRIAVVGGSLTGPALALLLVQAGFEHVDLYEATPAAATQGGGLLSLEHCALDVLDGLGIGQHEYVKNRFQTITHITRGSNRGGQKVVQRVYPGQFTTWSLLHAALIARLPQQVLHRGHRVTGLSHGNGRPMLHFAERPSQPADLVAFADGRTSIGRRLLDGGRALRYAGYIAHRGRTPATPTCLSDFRRLEPCPGVQFNIAPVPAGSDWTFYLNATADQYAAWFGAAPQQRAFALPHHVSAAARVHVNAHAGRHLPGDHAAVVHATAARMAVPVMDIDPPRRMVWPLDGGHAVLLGDALAPVRPHTGRGVNNGIEQAAGLVAALRQHHRHGADLHAALRGWQRRQLPTALAAVRLGPHIGDQLGLGAPLATPRPVPEAAALG
jgi:2,6-dihydroxypyridine 3-monooxygenase